jgi:hypothetical protein
MKNLIVGEGVFADYQFREDNEYYNIIYFKNGFDLDF